MSNLISFINSFLSYALVYVIMGFIIVIGCVAGIRIRKSKDAKTAAESLLSDKDTKQ